MKTPIADFIDNYNGASPSRFHMPGHKGMGDIEKYDITEIDGADVLYSADGIINESEENATKLFNTAHTFYSTEGSTLAIKAMLFLVSKGKSKKILAQRNVHKAFVYGCALLDLDVEWIYPKAFEHLCSCIVTKEDVEAALSEKSEPPCAVYITSPDYLGNVADVSGIATVCKKAGVPLIVDNAHGAYLGFLSPSMHPIAQGAAMCADSAHKTLPVLTGGAYLHISKDRPEYVKNARSALSLFASTSPSYLILRSLDKCNRYIDEAFPAELEKAIERTNFAKAKLSELGFSVNPGEPLKIVIDAEKAGYEGNELSELLRRNNIEAEFADRRYLVLMSSPMNTNEDFERLIDCFKKIELRSPIVSDTLAPEKAIKVMTIREAILSDSESISVDRAEGRICASPSVSCPPAVPIAVSGEIISKNHVELFKKYGIETVDIIK